MDCAFGTNVGETGETVVAYLLLAMLFAVVNYFLAWSCTRWNRGWVLRLLAFRSSADRLVFGLGSGWQLDDRVGKGR